MFSRIFITWLLSMLLILTGKVMTADAADEIKLPAPSYKGKMSVEQAIQDRKSIRSFEDIPLSINDVSQLLWSAGGVTVDGVTGPTRAYPSAGAVYPLEIYLVAGNVRTLTSGIYRYDWKDHSLILMKKGDFRVPLARAALGQQMIRNAPVTIVITARYDKATRRYGQRGATRYISMDAGHLGQNVHLQAQSIGLGTVMVGAFRDAEAAGVLGVKGETPIYMMPVGRTRR